MNPLQRACLRHCKPPSVPTSIRPQRRWARVHDVRFLATHQNNERITDRYKEKLQKKANEEGLGDINQLKDAYKDKIKDLRKKAAVPGATAPLSHQSQVSGQSNHSNPQGSPHPSSQQLSSTKSSEPIKDHSSPFKSSGVKTLSSFIDIPKTMELPPREIEAIWRLRHAENPQSLAAAIPSSTFAAIATTARKHPYFILPGLPRKAVEGEHNETNPTPEGAPIHFMQWNFTGPDTVTVLFTHLAEYKLRGEHAQPHTTMTHHLELADPKGLVLCQGHVMDGRGVSVEEGKWLVMNMQKFYNTQSIEEMQRQETPSDVGTELKKRRRKLVEQFNQGDASFKVEDLLEEAERMG